MEQVLGEEDEETRHELAERAKQLQDLVEKTKKDKEEMSSRYVEEKKRMEAKIAKMGEGEGVWRGCPSTARGGDKAEGYCDSYPQVGF